MSGLKEDLRKFRVRMLPSYSEETLERASRRIERFARLGLNVYEIDVAWVYEYCSGQLKSGKLRKSLRIEMEDLSRWCLFTDQKAELPRFRKEPSPDPRFPTEEEYSDLLALCRTRRKERIRDYLKQAEHERKWFRNELILRVLAEGGMRVSELIRVNVQDVAEKGLFIRSSKREKNRFVALSPGTLDMIRTWISDWRQSTDEKALFTGDYGRMGTTMIRKDVKQIGRMTGQGDLHPHALRHFCATRLLRAGIDIRKIQVHLGHASIQSTQEYTHLLTSDVQVEIYNLYAKEREPDFFRVEAVIAE